ncbi:MAG: DUF1800 family protein [Bdellovibrionaceae bacterium]|nr:DUF1800 family protein [Pseudobdellovibrionaceae bacterium]
MLYKSLIILFLFSNISLALNIEEAGHLLRRTEFGPTTERLEQLLSKTRITAAKSLFVSPPISNKKSKYRQFIDLSLNYESNVKKLVEQYQKEQKPISKTDFESKHKELSRQYLSQVLKQFYKKPQMMSEAMNKRLNKKRKRIFKDIKKYEISHAFTIMSRFFITGRDLQAWWLEEMLHSPEPLREMMTLFWHNHFATSFNKVRDSSLMALQNHTLRQNAFEPFGKLLKAMSEDKALLLYLDAQQNHKDHPNENFARELMELFTLGLGHYTESDIKETARALTGFMPIFNNSKSRVFIFNPLIQDTTNKTVLGETGNFNKKDIIDILLKQKQTARHIVRKLWLYFISPTPNEALITQWSDSFYKSNYDTKALLFTLFSSSAFYDSKANLIKSPTDYVVGSLKSFNRNLNLNPKGAHRSSKPIGSKMSKMGQALFIPPNVAGWSGYTEKGYKEWVTTTTLPKRESFLRGILSKSSNIQNWIDWLKKYNKNSLKDNFIKIFFALPPVETDYSSNKNTNYNIWIKEVLLDPSYQLK